MLAQLNRKDLWPGQIIRRMEDGKVELRIFDKKGLKDPGTTKVVNEDALSQLEYDELVRRLNAGDFSSGELRNAYSKAFGILSQSK